MKNWIGHGDAQIKITPNTLLVGNECIGNHSNPNKSRKNPSQSAHFLINPH